LEVPCVDKQAACQLKRTQLLDEHSVMAGGAETTKGGRHMDNSIKRLVPIPEVRQVLGGIGHTTVYDLIKRGEIVKVNIGRRGFITSESLEAYLDRLSA
jgi:hypothetical protein